MKKKGLNTRQGMTSRHGGRMAVVLSNPDHVAKYITRDRLQANEYSYDETSFPTSRIPKGICKQKQYERPKTSQDPASCNITSPLIQALGSLA